MIACLRTEKFSRSFLKKYRKTETFMKM